MSSSKPYDRSENPYLKLNFFKFFALSTAMILFFPWSLLFCLIVLGFEQTKLIIYALIEDIAITLLGALAAFVVFILINCERFRDFLKFNFYIYTTREI